VYLQISTELTTCRIISNDACYFDGTYTESGISPMHVKEAFLIPHIPEVLKYHVVDVRTQNKVPQLQS